MVDLLKVARRELFHRRLANCIFILRAAGIRSDGTGKRSRMMINWRKQDGTDLYPITSSS
jgi:hypothetical protein